MARSFQVLLPLVGFLFVTAGTPTETVSKLALGSGPVANEPVYRDGDWWKVKFVFKRLGSMSSSGNCQDWYSDFIVKIEGGEPKVYGIKDNKPEEIYCPRITERLLNSKAADSERRRREYLKFPLAVGSTWTHSAVRTRERKSPTTGVIGKTHWRQLEYRVLSFEIIRIPKGEFDAYKIKQQRLEPNRRGETSAATYYYAPQVKAIILYELKNRRREINLAVVDFNVSQ